MFQQIRVGRTEILVPVGIRRVSSGLWTHSACRPSAVAFSNLAGRVSKLWLRPLRVGTVEWSPPIDAAEWEAWLSHVSAIVGGQVSDWLVIPPANPHRRRFALIVRDRRGLELGFVKWSRNPPNPLGLEAEDSFGHRPPDRFVLPRILDHGTADGWSYTINASLPAGPHRPARLSPPERRALLDEIHGRLHELNGTSVIHGDFAPWNVRELSTGELAVIDWEQVGPAPPAVDELWYLLTETLSTGGTVDDAETRVRIEMARDASDVREAAEFLSRREDREPPEADASVERSEALLRFEERISEVLGRFRR